MLFHTTLSLSQALLMAEQCSNLTTGAISEDKNSIVTADKSDLPMICAREGSPPLPDTHNTSFTGLVLDPISNGSLAIEGFQFAEKCYPMQKNVLIRLTNEQVDFSFCISHFAGNVSVEGCLSPAVSGQFCNQTIDHLSCVDQNSTNGIITSCKNDGERSCIHGNESKLYSLDLLGVSEELIISATNVIFNQTQSNGASDGSRVVLMCYARHGAISSSSAHDYSGDINSAPLVIRSPKVGRWYITVVPLSNETVGNMTLCYSLEWKLLHCPIDKTGLNYNSEEESRRTFRIILFADIPLGAAGGSIHIRMNSDTKINHEIYASYGGLPFEDRWDYFYANSTSNSNGSMFFKLYDSGEKTISFYIVYVRGGTWSFGVKHLTSAGNALKSQTTMSISIERCPRRCSSHGTCQNVVEMSATVRVIVTMEVLTAVLKLSHIEAFAEWVLYTSSGISSGLYHACDVGTWCALSFRVLQFMDFWLSFMAVVSTFVYLADIDEGSKRTIHTVVAILTALMAENGATRSSNIVLVIAIGATGLLVGFLIEFCRHYRRFSFSAELFLNLIHRWHTIKQWCRNLIKTVLKRFRWFFVLTGFVALAMAAISWHLESTNSYWFWHSIWHVSIYISSFLFLCSKVNPLNCANGEPRNTNYELTRQDSLSRSQGQPENGQAR
ncbi:Protein of unknown function DUF3522 [Cynara cardunculus var. scolymus]|uniref:Uncharacterized protein n=1 Tax=Cynara cardunculus var. scolymus TaxID=59895 RepID=A0A103XUW9_CYNCS|nr:Protein of unknown function DUF3522 [Cynara cardunculus var. scolymus]